MKLHIEKYKIYSIDKLVASMSKSYSLIVSMMGLNHTHFANSEYDLYAYTCNITRIGN